MFPAYKAEDVDKSNYTSDQLSWLCNESYRDALGPINSGNQLEETSVRVDSSDDNAVEVLEDKNNFNRQKRHKTRKKAKKKHSKRKLKKSKLYSLGGKDKFSELLSTNASVPTSDGNQKSLFADCPLKFAKLDNVLYFDHLPDKNNSIFAQTHYSQKTNYSKNTLAPLGAFYSHSNKKIKLKRYYCRKLCKNPDIPEKASEYSEIEYIPMKTPWSELKSECNRKQNNSKAKEDSWNVDSLGILDQPTLEYAQGRKSIMEDLEIYTDPEKKFWQNKIKSFNERLSSEPDNIELWLEFISIQDKAIFYIFDTGAKENSKILLERKLSIIDSAIQKNPNSIKLRLNRINIGKKIWEISKLKSDWNNLIHLSPNNNYVWSKYLIFYHTYFPIFDLDTIIDAYFLCFSSLVQSFHVHIKNASELCTELIDLVSKMAFTWRQCGYMERSIALFQALIEINFFCPSKLKCSDYQVKIDLFEAFWDSRAPRFGEKNSIGWSEFMIKKKPVQFSDEILEGQKDEEDTIISAGGKKPHLLIQLEKSREKNHWLPYQNDPDYCEDPERMVPYSILKRFLFGIEAEDDRFYLVLRFLEFLGVDISSQECLSTSSDEEFFAVRIESLRKLSGLNFVNYFRKTNFDFNVMGPSLKDEDYFEFIENSIYKYIDIFEAKYKPKFAEILIKLYCDKCMIFKQAQNFSSVVKFYREKIKKLLQQEMFRNNFKIFYQYGIFEISVGRLKDAVRTHTMALTAQLQCTDLNSIGENTEVVLEHLMSLIFIDLKKEKLDKDTCDKMLNLIGSVFVKNSINDCNILNVLKAKRKLNSLIDTNLNDFDSKTNKGKIKILNAYIYMLAILQLFSLGLKPACLIFEGVIEKMQQFKISENVEKLEYENFGKNKINSNQKFFEILYENYLCIIELNLKLTFLPNCRPMPVRDVREIVEAALLISPKNEVFLNKLIRYQNWREIFRSDVNLSSSDAISSIYQILPHMKNFDVFLSSEGITSCGYQLENALNIILNANGEHCPLLWRIYLKVTKEIKPKNLKTVVYRALHSCPMSKVIYLDCIELLPSAMDDILKLMNEKGLRNRIPIEELDLLLENEMDENFVDEDLTKSEISTMNDTESLVKQEILTINDWESSTKNKTSTTDDWESSTKNKTSTTDDCESLEKQEMSMINEN